MGAPAKIERARPAPIRQAAHGRAGPALRVGAANDPAEHEAEAAAERVARGLPAGVGGAPAAPPPARRIEQPNLDTLEAPVSLTGPEQDVTVPDTQNVDLNALDGGDTAEIASGEPDVQRMAAEVGAAGGAAPADVAARVAAPGGGRALPGPVRARMEAAFGRDFGAVRLHDSGGDRSDAERLGARAFTAGHDIWLGPGERADDTRLMAHELTHVVQGERGGGARPARRFALVDLLPMRPPASVVQEVEDYLANVPGYSLLRVALGQELVSGRAVARNATNIVRGVLGTIPVVGEQLFRQLNETNAIETASRWVSERMTALDLTGARVLRTLRAVATNFSIFDARQSIMRTLRPLLDDALTFAGEAKDKILEFIVKLALKMAGPYGERIWAIVQRARESLGLILADPGRFALNLIRAVMQGFGQFRDKLGDHMKRGLMNWLFGALGGAGLQIPARLDLRGLVSLGLQVVGLTWARWRERLARRLDPSGMRKIQLLEAGVDIIRTLATEGFAGLWRKLLEMIDNFRQTVLGGIKTFVTETVIRQGIQWLASLTNPIGGIVRIALAIYDMVKVFLERLDQIMQVAESLFNGMAAIARGQTNEAANRVEETMGRSVPVVISFVAGLLGLGGISGRIRAILERLRAPIDRALERLVGFLARKAKQFMSRILGRLNRRRQLAEAPFTIGTARHRLFAQRQGRGVAIKIASNPTALREGERQIAAVAPEMANQQSSNSLTQAAAKVGETRTQTDPTVRRVDLESENASQRQPLATLDTTLHAKAAEVQQAVAVAAADPQLETSPAGGPLIRAREPRLDTVEGAVGTYYQRGQATQRNVPRSPSRRRISSFVENDHVIEKQWPKRLIEALSKGELNPPGAARNRDGRPSARATPKIGQLTRRSAISNNMQTYPAISIFRAIHDAKDVTRKANINAAITAAAATPIPGVTIKQSIRDDLQRESDEIAQLYSRDTGAPPSVRASVMTGLRDIRRLNFERYGLGTGAESDSTTPSVAASGGTDSRSEAPFAPRQGAARVGVPNFSATEGLYRPYSLREQNVGLFMEFDHVVEKGWPLRAQGITFANALLIGPVEAALGRGSPGPADPVVAARLAALRQEWLFHNGIPVRRYTEENGKAIALYLPIHRAASLGAQPPGSAEAVLERLGTGFVAPAVRYLRTGEDAAKNDAFDRVRTHIRRRVEAATTRHTGVISRQYDTEPPRIRAANPGREDAAIAAFAPIADRIRTSVRTAREEVVQIFSAP
ncbi:MAG: DUF4157 domain-containing protein [Pseudomonadota bacterium]